MQPLVEEVEPERVAQVRQHDAGRGGVLAVLAERAGTEVGLDLVGEGQEALADLGVGGRGDAGLGLCSPCGRSRASRPADPAASQIARRPATASSPPGGRRSTARGSRARPGSPSGTRAGARPRPGPSTGGSCGRHRARRGRWRERRRSWACGPTRCRRAGSPSVGRTPSTGPSRAGSAPCRRSAPGSRPPTACRRRRPARRARRPGRTGTRLGAPSVRMRASATSRSLSHSVSTSDDCSKARHSAARLSVLRKQRRAAVERGDARGGQPPLACRGGRARRGRAWGCGAS